MAPQYDVIIHSWIILEEKQKEKRKIYSYELIVLQTDDIKCMYQLGAFLPLNFFINFCASW